MVYINRFFLNVFDQFRKFYLSSNYYDREKLRTEMNQAFGAELAESAYIMSGTSTGEVISNSNFTNTEPGMARGGEKGNDSYIFLTLSVYKTITNKNYKDK